MVLKLLTTGLALSVLGSLIGCADANNAIEGANVEEKFRFVAKNNPDFALGLAYADLNTVPKVMVAGPIEKGSDIAVQKEARWHIGSISKSFTATLIMKLVERGVLDLDAPIGQYLDKYRETMHADWQSITLRQLLSHTAGVPANASGRVMIASASYDPYQGRRTVLSGLWEKPLPRQAGGFEYSNIGYVLAGLVAEEVTGTTWENLIKSEIAQPLGLTSLGFGAPTGDTDPKGHSTNFGITVSVGPNETFSDNPAWMGPAGTIHLSIADLAKWGQVHLRACRGQMQGFLRQTSCKTMQTPISNGYGLGWVVENSADSKSVVWHNGSNTMWYAMLYLDVKNATAVAAVTNVAADAHIDGLTRAVSADL